MADGFVEVTPSTDPTLKRVDNEFLTVGANSVYRQRVAVPDGANVAEGATIDAAVVTDVNGTVSGKLRGLVKILASVWDSVNGRLKVDGSTVTQPVSGTFWQATQPVSGTVTANVGTTNGLALDATLTGGSAKATARGGAKGTTTAADVTSTASGANHQPLDTAIYDAAGNLLDPRAIRALTTADAVNVGQWVGSAAPTVGQKAMASSLPVTVASDQTAIPTTKVAASGQTNVLKTGSLVTTAVTADQVVLTYTVTAAKTLYLTHLIMYGRLTVVAATASILGTISLETPSGTKVITLDDVNPTTSECEFNPIVFAEALPIAAGVVIRVVVTPAAATSMTWRANFGGYEK